MSVQYKIMMVRNQHLTCKQYKHTTIHFEKLYKRKLTRTAVPHFIKSSPLIIKTDNSTGLTMKMNKFILLATFLAVAVSVSHAMPNVELEDEDEDDDMQAFLQEMEVARSLHGVSAKTQWRARRVIRRVVETVKKVCSIVPVVEYICGRAERKAAIETENQIADEQVCEYVTIAKTVCKFVKVFGQ